MKSPVKTVIFGAVAIFLIGSLKANQPQMSFTAGSSGTWNADWQGLSNRTYFFQWSLDLVTWQYAPFLDYGNGMKSHGVATQNASKFFVRLVHVDFPWVQSMDEANLADFDGDGIPNLFEIGTLGTNPFDKMSDGGDSNANDIPDGYELYHFGFLGASPLSADSDGDGLSNQIELMLGMNASSTFEAGTSSNWEIHLPN